MTSLRNKMVDRAITYISGLFKIFSKTEEPTIIDDTGVGGVIYVGFSAFGTDTSKPKYKIKKVTEVGTITTIQYADGDMEFDNIWDDRTTLTYA